MTIRVGARHLRSEFGRWWRTDDLSDAHVGHSVLNDQYRLWNRVHQRARSEVSASVSQLEKQQRLSQSMQQQRMAAMKYAARTGGGRGGRGRYGYGGGLGMGLMMGGSSPMVAYRMMQWRELGIRVSREEFEAPEVTPAMLAAGRGQVGARRHRTAVLLALVLAAAVFGIWWASLLAGLAVTAVAGAVFTVAAWSAGRNPVRRRPPIPKLLFVPGKQSPDLAIEPEPEPFPLREAGRTPRVAREAVRLALIHHGAGADVALPIETAYGWRVPMTLTSATLADVSRILAKLAKTLRVGEGRVLARPTDPEDAALIELLILTSDPFKDPLPYPQRRPLSCTIKAPVSLGLSIDGETTPVVLAGQHVIVVGRTGAGKSALLQAIAEYVTACADAVIVDVDPFKRGLRSLSSLAARTARSPQEAETVLADLLALAQARIASMPDTQEVWEPTPEGPAVLAVLDEVPKLSARGRELAIELLRVGREAHVTIVLLSQDATEDALGDSIADSFGVRVLMSCRMADVPLVVGQPDAVSRGWLPHLLIPSPDPTDPADAGKFYCVTPRHRSPILRYVSKLAPDAAAQLAKERLAAGRPQLTAPARTASAGTPGDAPAIVRLLLDVFAAAGNPETMTIEQLAPHLVKMDSATWGQWEGKHNRRTMIGRRIREALKAAQVDVQPHRVEGVPGRPAAYRLSDLQAAAAG